MVLILLKTVSINNCEIEHFSDIYGCGCENVYSVFSIWNLKKREKDTIYRAVPVRLQCVDWKY